MTNPLLSIGSQDYPPNKSRKPSSGRLHLIQMEDVEPPQKGLYAVVHANNEELVIGSVVLHIRQLVDRVIVVDDGSTDRTTEVAKFGGADVIQLILNSAKAYALIRNKQGFK